MLLGFKWIICYPISGCHLFCQPDEILLFSGKEISFAAQDSISFAHAKSTAVSLPIVHSFEIVQEERREYCEERNVEHDYD